MGNTNACCSIESKPSEHIKTGGGRSTSTPVDERVHTDNTHLVPTAAELQSFRTRLENSISIMVVIADGKKIHCRLRWQPSEQGFVMTCEANNHLHIRRISLDELVTVIHGSKDLGRVATRAKIADDPSCVALHLASNTCIPICLENESDKNCFVYTVRQLKEEGAT